MKVLDVKEHEDGSATYTFDVTPEENNALLHNGLMWSLVCLATGMTIDKAIEYGDTGKLIDEQRQAE